MSGPLRCVDRKGRRLGRPALSLAGEVILTLFFVFVFGAPASSLIAERLKNSSFDGATEMPAKHEGSERFVASGDG